MRLLCLSNGHGEDAIALRILQALQQLPDAPTIEALPIVGEGHAYTKAGIPLVGAVKPMPSGGFIYMDSRQLARDIRGGLLQLTLTQLKAIRQWARESTPTPDTRHPPTFILAVGDIVPLLFAWWSGVPYAFIGTAKSEYYIRDEAGWLPRKSWWSDRFERWTGCIYLPWERWLMSRPLCKAVFPRDTITAKNLRRLGIPAFDMGNPMMDGLEGREELRVKSEELRVKSEELRVKSEELGVKGEELEAENFTSASKPQNDPTQNSKLKTQNLQLSTLNSQFSTLNSQLSIVLLPGSRPSEAYANWEIILLAVNNLLANLQRPLMLLAAIAPGLDLEILHQTVRSFRWQQVAEDTYTVGLGEKQATLVLAQNHYAEFLHQADIAIAMAGTATEQFVGLGKPAITIPGKGPQFTPAFAEAQTRLLGTSITLIPEPQQATAAIQGLLQNPDRLQLIAENGIKRMGKPGSAQRIAQCLLERMRG